MLILQKIEDIVCKSTDAGAAVGKFLLQEKGKLEDYSMIEVADLTYTSRATLVRFAKKLGYSGWSDFVKAFLKEVRYFESSMTGVDFNIPFEEKDSFRAIAEKAAQVRREANQDTLSLLDEKALRKAVRIMKASERIMMSSASVNVSLAQLFQHKMLRIGKIVENVAHGEPAFMSFALRPTDCVIMISYSGNSRDRIPTSTISFLKERNIPLIGITSMGDNLLREYADCTLTISSRENLYSKIASYATEESISLLLDILYSCYFAENYQENMQKKIEMSEQIEKRRILAGQQQKK